MRSHHRLGRTVVLLLSIAAVAAVASSIASAHGNAKGKGGSKNTQGKKSAVYVSPSGKTGASDKNCSSAAYTSVQSAVDAAAAGGKTVVVCKGTYTEDVIISSPLTLSGQHGAVIHGSSTANGNCEQLGPSGLGSAPCLAAITIKSSRVTVEGLKVTGATGEGILATGSLAGGSISHVLITKNTVVGNDLGGIPPSTTSPYPQCVEQDQIPGDCGEGIHLMGVANSTVSHNMVSGNSGGVLLTDEFGPTHANKIEHNTITANLFDCGVTAPGHNPNALDASGNRQPSKAGVYGNTISHNTITNNGTKGEGAGVLFANATAGTASYNNTVSFNKISGNELSGVTMHAHTLAPGTFEDLSGNKITHNTIGTNNTGGDSLDGSVKDDSTTGILVFSASVPVTVTISHNIIRHDAIGIWLGVAGHVTATQSHNVFQFVTTQVLTSP
jgi:parallel beta-helix repeat protein